MPARPSRRRAALVGLTLAASLAACSADDAAPLPSPTTPATSPDTTAPPREPLVCDPLDERACLLPWPNDAFTDLDPTTRTGRRVAIHPEATPANASGVPIDVTDQNRADGFSPGSALLTHVPGLDLQRSGLAPSTDIGASLAADAPVVLLDTTTGERVPYWAELDAQAPEGDRLLMIRPAQALAEGHHFVVALRDLRDSAGRPIGRSAAFQAALEGHPEPPARRAELDATFERLRDAGVDPDTLYLAWDFTVASAESLSGRLLAMRADAYAALGEEPPQFDVLDQRDEGDVRTVEGTFEVPNYLTGDGSPGATMRLDADGTPLRSTEHPTISAGFRCVLPLAAASQVPTIVYGHGLLGGRQEVDSLAVLAATGLAGACATDWLGMSREDVANLAGILGDLSRFPEQADRLQQGILAFQFLGRALNHPGGFASHPAFQAPDGTPLHRPGDTQFVGNSQGGILGGAASAVSSEWSRVVLGVPGMNYSLLLSRSVDWPPFQQFFDRAYTDPAERVIALQLVQMLWDRGENTGYAQHLTTDPYPGIPAKEVLLVEAFGDHQVANVSTEVLARTIGAAVHRPSLAPGRSADVEPQWGLPAFTNYGGSGTLLVVWDFGTPAPPPGNVAPSSPQYGTDPHGAGAREPRVLQQAFTFLLTGRFVDVCAGQPCVSDVLGG